jgi:hypothetical protein
LHFQDFEDGIQSTRGVILRVNKDLHYNYKIIRKKKRILTILLEGRFELIFFHEHVHEGGLEKKKIITIDKI